VDETPTKIKPYELQIIGQMLNEDKKLTKFNQAAKHERPYKLFLLFFGPMHAIDLSSTSSCLCKRHALIYENLLMLMFPRRIKLAIFSCKLLGDSSFHIS